ncbi:MAG: hypothetical protein ACREVX_14430 [Clostridium sp.]|uniref:hypothetical protein n=1 Tax=Clostridium sp. TaxID=1506 RepID=UPI003D6CA2D6
MYGKIIDMNNTDAFVNFLNGTTVNVSVSRLPKNSKLGDTVDLNNESPSSMIKNSMINFF